MHPGYEKLYEYLKKDTPIAFHDFVKTEKENIGIWSSTCKSNSPQVLFGTWKDRFTKIWNREKNSRVDRIKYDEKIWKDIFQHTDLIRQNKNAYKLQGLDILRKLGAVCGREVMTSIENDIASSLEFDTDGNTTEPANAEFTVPNIQCPTIQTRYRIGDVDISLPFYIFQMVVKNNFMELNIEEHVQHILSLSSIFLVQDDHWHPDIKSVFGKDHLLLVHKTLQEQFSVRSFSSDFDKKLTDTIVDIVKDLKRKNISRLDAQIDLLQLARTSQSVDAKIIRSVAGLVEKLPRQELKDVIKETELNHRYVDTFLSPLFDNPDEGVLFRWTSVTNTEDGSLKSGSISKNRPDSCISELDSLYFDASLGFVEVKPNSQDDNKHAVSKDLIRLGMFSKNAIDKWLMRGCLSIQVVGYEATFYITTQPSAELYTMLELRKIRIPCCLSDLTSYITQFDELAAVLRYYENWCVHLPSEQAQCRGNKRATLLDEAFGTIAMSPKSNKRRFYTMH